jgi:hypothetical protein
MQAGIVVTGLLNIVVGLVIRAVGKDKIDMVLPPIVTGSVAAIIGFGLAAAALGRWQCGNWGVAMVTLLVDHPVLGLPAKRGFIGMIPVLLGAITGYIFGPARTRLGQFCSGCHYGAPGLPCRTSRSKSFSGAMVGPPSSAFRSWRSPPSPNPQRTFTRSACMWTASPRTPAGKI